MSKKIKTVLGADGFDYPITSPDLVVDNEGISATNKLDGINQDISNIKNNIDKILDAVDTPPTFTKPTLSISLNKSTIEHNVSTNIVITPNFKQNDSGGITNYVLKKGSEVLVDTASTQTYTDTVNISHGSSVTYTATASYSSGPSKTSTFGVEYPGISAGNISANTTARAYANSYYGVIDGSSVTEADISGLTSRLGTSKGFTITYNMTNQRSVYMYPQSFGVLSSIKDANNFEYLSSYTRTNMSYNGVNYYVYVLTDPVTITGFKQIFN